jgi:Uri superfamily endonuclease
MDVVRYCDAFTCTKVTSFFKNLNERIYKIGRNISRGIYVYVGKTTRGVGD